MQLHLLSRLRLGVGGSATKPLVFLLCQVVCHGHSGTIEQSPKCL